MQTNKAKFALSVIKEQLENYENRLIYLVDQIKIVKKNISSCKTNIRRLGMPKDFSRSSDKRKRLYEVIINILMDHPDGLGQTSVWKVLPDYTDEFFSLNSVCREMSLMTNNLVLDVVCNEKGRSLRWCLSLVEDK